MMQGLAVDRRRFRALELLDVRRGGASALLLVGWLNDVRRPGGVRLVHIRQSLVGIGGRRVGGGVVDRSSRSWTGIPCATSPGGACAVTSAPGLTASPFGSGRAKG